MATVVKLRTGYARFSPARAEWVGRSARRDADRELARLLNTTLDPDGLRGDVPNKSEALAREARRAFGVKIVETDFTPHIEDGVKY